MLIDYFRWGFSNLKQRRLRSWLTMIGIFIGVALVVSLISLGQGMQDAIIDQFSSLGADTLTVQAAGGGFGPPGSYQSVTIGKDDLRVIKRTPGVDEAFGRIIESVRVQVDGEQEFGFLATVADEPDEYRMSLEIPFDLKVVKGRMLKPGDTHKVVIGNRLAEKDVYVRKLQVGDKIGINGEDFDIIGVLEKTGNPQVESVLWLPLEVAQELTGVGDKYGVIAARVEEGADVAKVQSDVEKALRKERDVELGREDFVVESSQETIDSLNSIVGAVKWFLVGIALISLLVGSVGITNTMYTAVLERTKEIGIMKSIGATNNNVLTLFLIESGVIGFVGGIIGVALGMGLSFTTAAIAQANLGTDLISAHISFGLLLGALGGSFLVGTLAGVTPASQAARMKPVEALRYG